ncbi:unnamed protein product [Sphenostylis stenocarpa]|uniref:PHD-type domain-containing protein n=1 Tax=Sphenostylis stenocarpa TaxID=92480 RepID=A0AA86SS67_9FABA|nr:unnamed protein product [Sphenostylis stenocarpa]
MEEKPELSCDAEGVCLCCKQTPPPSELLPCHTCEAKWHLPCLPSPPVSSSDSHWDCPDCTGLSCQKAVPESTIVSAIRTVHADSSLTEKQKARKCQELVGGVPQPSEDENHENIFDGTLNCTICNQLPDRPVTVGSSLLLNQ